ncbi:MAG TPA: 2-dehydro-3-deoxygalactonokinase [Sphingopyxis sp.]|uniref:2-dehydro-3-deoxygalactonokinase n=1 Tax=Sphingopyxis sp. TaxID=1908224 RepID=UPI002C6079DC|nr:2-dehydro-3-deoxygalactonokinase [Sphingopyxis sp.]HWW59669.1 2-dehydro-3-deoxygalactonokinase [Sphingopyxis sp.]
MSDFIAIDWGTTNRRVYRIKGGEITATERDDCGVRAMAGKDYTAEIQAIVERFGDLPILLAGMVGSTIGWKDAGYAALPTGLAALARGLCVIDERTAIVPGVKLIEGARCDVMRGEEIQFLGAAHAGLTPTGALLCQPGTHCKWARLDGGKIVDFETAMTGELFALLKTHSIFAGSLDDAVVPDGAFRDGVLRGAENDLSAALFGVRAATVLGSLARENAASYASGLLIGADVANQVSPGQMVHILADPDLGRLYQTAIDLLGGAGRLIDSHSAFSAGIIAIQELRS